MSNGDKELEGLRQVTLAVLDALFLLLRARTLLAYIESAGTSSCGLYFFEEATSA